MSSDLACYRVMIHPGAPIMPSASCTSLWGHCSDLGLLQLLQFRFRNIIWKNEAGQLLEYTEGPDDYIHGCFLDGYPWIFRDDNTRIRPCFREHETSFSHTDRPPQNPDFNPSDNLLNPCAGEGWRRLELNLMTLQKLIQTMPQRWERKALQPNMSMWPFSDFWWRRFGRAAVSHL